MPPVAGDIEIGRTRTGDDEPSGQHRDQPEKAPSLSPQAEPQPAEQQQTERRHRHGRQHRYRARPPRDKMRQPDQPGQRSLAQPPDRRAQPDTVEQQRQRFQRHDQKCRQRDRDNIGQRPVQPGLVEMVERDRHQRDFHHQPGQEQRQQEPAHLAQPAFVAQHEQRLDPRLLVQRDNRGDRRKAQLETGPDQRFGPEDQYEQRPRRDHPQGDRAAPHHQRHQHQQRRDTGPDRRHLGSGQQRIG